MELRQEFLAGNTLNSQPVERPQDAEEATVDVDTPSTSSSQAKLDMSC